MAYVLNEKIRELKPYDPVNGDYHIRLDANESFREPPARIISKITEAAAEIPYNRYPDPFASELCQNFAKFYNVDAANVTAGNGSDELISIINSAFLMKGDTVMTLSPDFSMYKFYCSINETKCVEYQKQPDFSIDIDKLIFLIKEYNIKMLIFSNPCNPTSKGIKREEIRRLIRGVGALVVLDEAYMDFWDQTMLGEVESYDNLIILRTCSKAFGMAGIRLGFAVANSALTNSLKAVKSPYNVNIFTQKAGTIILSEQEWVHSCTNEIVKSKDELYAMLKRVEKNNSNKMTVYDSVTNFILIKMSESLRVFNSLLRAGIAVRYLGDYLRVSAGNTEENIEFIKNFKNII